MDFLDLTAYSPTSEALTYPDTFEKAYLADSYTTLPDYTVNGYEDDAFFDHSTSTVDQNYWSLSQSLASRDYKSDSTLRASTAPGPIITNPHAWSTLHPTPFGGIGNLNNAFTGNIPTSPCLSPQSLTRGSISSGVHDPQSPPSSTQSHHSEEEVATKPPPRKRGRPRLYRQTSAPSDGSASEKVLYPQRLPHNQVERKYREGLNMELERLRRAVPTLPQSEKADVMGAAKPSKAMVLAAAIDYIKRIEKERDAAVHEVERLGGKIRAGMVAKACSKA
ncbi:hypothetical protein K458DRAFT_414214 [Lentithecium fluviatile CBS 122367]|uniref:BHLH domain-containing protein n=1 Tax=Lentithecium fluviatile CBS 122367 TaxID=1168545 RepID=A0A6G1JD29_9PLEO|nr:hypothetical protein K458DRAFT_414214 [Lentithecium fluviatile CBS 122367]